MKRILVFVLICMSGIMCRAAEDGNSLLRECQAAVKSFDGEKLDIRDSLNAAYCVAYVSGILDLDAMWLAYDKKDAPKNIPLHVCTPEGEGLESGQSVRIIVKWLKANPEKLHWRGETVVVMALRQAFPCK